MRQSQKIAAILIDTERKVLVTMTQLGIPLLRACCSSRGCSIRTWRSRAFAILVAIFSVGFVAAPSDAAFVSTKEAEMDAIFGQASFGATPIDIRYLPTITHVDPNLLNINTSAKLSSLFSLTPPPLAHNVYFVDTVDWCSTFLTGIVGCGNQPGNDFVVESVYASGASGAELLAHELAHNLALGHVGNNGSKDNLMNPVVGYPSPPATTTLTVAQANTILSRPTVQTDINNGSLYIEIQPVLIVASLVPEPSSLALTLGIFGMSALGFRRRRT